jgi:hypothetical protein
MYAKIESERLAFIRFNHENINQPQLCNGTGLAVQTLMSNAILATILTGHSRVRVSLFLEFP